MKEFLRGKEIVIFGLQPWDIEIGSNCKSIALELSKHNKVLYVNRALDRVSMIKFRNDAKIKTRLESLKGLSDDLVSDRENLWVLNPRTVLESAAQIPFKPLFDKVNFLNNRRLAREIKSAMERLSFETPIIFIDNEFFRAFYFKELIPHALLIYYMRDFLTEQKYFKRHGKRLETQLMAKADLVAANSSYLADYAKSYNTNSYFIGQGCDLTLFNPELKIEEPEDLKPIKNPRIGYVGFISTSRLDLSLLVQMARSKPEWSIVLVGPEDQIFQKSELHQLENVHFLGRKEKKDLQNYIRFFDVCINPQVKNAQTEGNYPLKIDEYLAMGKPVVATKTSTMEMFSNHVGLASSPPEYISEIERALNDENPESCQRRIAFAKSHTWSECVRILNEAINETV